MNLAGAGLDRLSPLLGGALLGAPLLVVAWPPASDLALHEGMVALLVHHGDPAFAPPGLYRLALGHANQLFYLLAFPLALVTSAGLACRVVLAASVAGALVAGGALAHHLGRPRWAALALAPAALGWTVYWGFAPQALGFALWLAALPWLDRDADRGTVRGALRSTAVVAGLGLAHASAMLCACVAIGVLAAPRAGLRRLPLRLAPAAAGLALALLEDRWERRVATPLARVFGSTVLWHPLGRKLGDLVADLAGGHGTVTEATMGLLALVAVAVWRVREPEGTAPATRARPAAVRERLERHRFALLAAALFALYLGAPYSVNFGAFLYVRFLAPAYAVAMLCLAPMAAKGARAATLGSRVLAATPAAALLVAPLVAALPQLQAAAQQARTLAPLLGRVEPDSATAVLHFGRYDHGLLFDPTSFAHRVLAGRGGRELFSFAEYPIAPVVVDPALRWDALVLRTSTRSGAFQPAHDLARVQWVLAHVHDPGLAPRVVRAFAPEAELVEASGEWMLFRSRLAVLPIDAPEGPEDPAAETLQERVTRGM